MAVIAGGSPVVAFIVDIVTSLGSFAALVMMGKAFKQIHDAQGELVTGGLYAYVRHPQYSALFLLIVSMLIQWPSLTSAIMAPILIVTYTRLARREEREVTEKFGERYLAYRSHTASFVPDWGMLRKRWAMVSTAGTRL